jgi:hypothetical protein
MTDSPLPFIDVIVDEIVIRGLEPGQQYQFANALEARLTALIEADVASATGWRGRDESSRRVPAVDADAGPASLGNAVAATVSGVIADRRGDG